MPRTSRLHKHFGQAIVTIQGKDHYLGPHGSAKSKEAYTQLISEYSAINKTDSPKSPVLHNARTGRMSMLELLAAFWLHAEEYHVGRDGRANSEQKNYRTLVARLRRFGGDLEVAD